MKSLLLLDAHHEGGLPTAAFGLTVALLVVFLANAVAATPLPAASRQAAPLATPTEPEIFSNGNDLQVVEIEPRTGFVWGAGEGGVVRHDPATGQQVKYTVTDGLADDLVTAIGFDRAGNRWFGTYSGVSRLSADGIWDSFPDPWGDRDPEDLRPISAIVEHTDGSVLFALTGRGLGLRRRDGTWSRFAVPAELGRLDRVEGLAVSPSGDLWIGGMANAVLQLTAAGVWRRHEGAYFERTRNFAFDTRGNVWMATLRGIVRVDREDRHFHYTPATTQGKLPFNQAADVAVDADGGVWISEPIGPLSAGRGAIVFYPDSENWLTWSHHVYTATRGVSDPRVTSIAASSDGLWLGVRRMGLARLVAEPAPRVGMTTRYQDARFESHTLPDWAGGSMIWDLAFDRDGALWVAGWDALSRRDPTGAWTHFRDELPHASPRHVAFDRRGGTWVATRGGLAYRDAAGAWRQVKRTGAGSPIPDNNMWWVEVAPDDSVWATTMKGVVVLDPAGKVIATHDTTTTAGALPSNNTWALAFDDDGGTWIGTDKGVGWRTPDGAWFRTRLDRQFIHSIVSDPWRDLWFGAWRTEGAHRLTRQGWERFGVSSGLADDSVQDFAFETSGATWFGTRVGVSRLDPNGDWMHLGSAHGLPNPFVQALAIDATNGDLWIGSHGGLMRLPGSAVPLCARAVPAARDGSVDGRLERPDDVAIFQVDIDQPYTTVHVELKDPKAVLDVFVTRDCNRAGGGGRRIGIGSGRHIGDPLRGTFDVGANTGTYYLVVRPIEGVEAATLPADFVLSLRLGRTDTGESRTLILTDPARLAALHGVAGDSSTMLAWRAALDRLALHDRVRGRIVDLGRLDDDPTLKAAYQDWATQAQDPQNANRLAAALQTWLQAQRLATPTLRYVVLAGDDRLIPFARLSVFPVDGTSGDWSHESDYLAESAIPPSSGTGLALAADTTLTDDIYGARGSIAWRAHQRLYVPELAVGRLLEGPTDMIRSIEHFLARDGRLELRSGVVAGWDFMEDGARQVNQTLAGRQAEPRTGDTFLGSRWGTAELGARLAAGALDLLFVAMHADHRQLEGPDRRQLGPAELWPGVDGDTVVFGLACHAGLNVPTVREPNAPPDDLAELWLRRGAVIVGSTGWAYGMDGQLGYQERLMADFAEQLLAGDGTAIGDALVGAKQHYFAQHLLNQYHAKTLAGTNLYGLPMYLVSSAPLPEGGAPSAARRPTTETLRQGPAPAIAERIETGRTAAGEPFDRLRVTWEVDRQRLSLRATDQGRYYTFHSAPPHAESGQAVQPMSLERLSARSLDGQSVTPRGVLLEAAFYTEELFLDPLVVHAGPLGTHRRPAAVAAGGPVSDAWLPGAFVSFQTLSFAGAGAAATSELQLRISVGQYNFARQTERLYHRFDMTQHFSAAADTVAPQIVSLAVRTAEAGEEYAVQAYDESGIERVALTCDDQRGAWSTTNLNELPASAAWSGTVPRGSKCILQVVDAAQNVAVDDNAGMYYPARRGQPRAWLPAVWANR